MTGNTARRAFLWVGACGLLLGMAVACSKGAEQPGTAPGPGAATPAGATGGEALFNLHCSRCHGANGTGTAEGPPLVDKIYEPSHHPDEAFYRAVAMGVRAHHWNFGDMPAMTGLTQDDTARIIAFVRSLQRQAGIQ